MGGWWGLVGKIRYIIEQYEEDAHFFLVLFFREPLLSSALTMVSAGGIEHNVKRYPKPGGQWRAFC